MNKIRINKKILFIISLILMVCVISFFCVPIKDGRSIFANIQYNKKLAGAIQPDNYDKMKITSARITERITGTSKFNTSDGNSVDDGSIVSDLEGNDVSSVDNYIRTYDTLTYSVEINVDRNEYMTTDLDVLTGGVIKVRVTVPKDSETNIPWLVIKKDAWMKDVELSDDFTELTANYQVPTSESLIGGIQELSFRFVAQGYVGEIPANMKPTIEIWMEGNKPDNSSSHYDKKVLTDSEILYSTGKQDYELTLKQGLINRKSSLNGVNGQYLSFGVQLDYKNELRGMEYPYKGINSKIKLEYYYSNPLSGEGWIKLDRNNAEDRRILDGIQLVASGLICEETDNFWPSTSSNKLKGTSSGCYYKGIDRLGSWGDKYPYRYNSGDINATYSNDVLSFNNRNNYFYGYADSGYSHFLVDGFELFIPYYNDGMANYEYQIRLVADELTGYNYQNEPTELNVDSQLSVKLINSVSGNIRAIVERLSCAGCSTSVTPINRYETFYSEINIEDGPYEGGEERLIVWTSSLATLRKESNGEGYYSFEYEPEDGVTTIDNTSTSYGIYKNDPVGGIPTTDLTNAALYEDFYWYDTYDEASSMGTISAIHIDSPDYRGYGISSEIQFNLVGRNNKENIGKVGIIRHKINLYKDQDRTIQYSLGYNQNYTPSVINEDGEEINRGTPSTIGHSFVISALDMSLSIIPRSSITGNVQTNFNVQDKYLNIELKPTVTNLIDEEFNSNFRLHIRFGKYLTYREGSANIEPTRIQEDGGYNGQALYWNLTDINVSEVPTITFQMEMSPFTPNNYNSGASPDAYLYSPAFPVDDGFDRQPLSFTNLAGSTIRKNVNKDIIEANESFEITDTIYNISDEILQNVKTFEILPKNNDSNGSSFHGDYTLKILELAEGQRIFYTTSAINTLGLTQDDDGNLTLRNVTLQNNPQWTEVQINGIIPANATAIGSTISLIDTMSTKGFKYQVIPSNNGYGDKYIFKSLATSDNLTTTIKSDILRVSIVSRNIEGKAYIDLNRNNKYDSSDSLIANHQVKLLNSTHQVVETTTTDNDGKYSFKNLPSGTYYVDFGQKDYYNIIPKGEGNKANSDGLTDLITELSETPTQVEITVSNIDVGYAKKPATLTTKYLIYGTDTNLFDPVTQTVYYTDSYTALPPSDPIPTNYEFYRNDGDPVTGIVNKDNITVIYYYELKSSTITVHHYAINSTTKVAPDQVLHKKYTEHYETNPVTPTNPNYEYANSHGGDPVSGTVELDSYEIKYYYKKKTSNITVNYIDEANNPKAPQKKETKEYEENVCYPPIEITGYSYLRTTSTISLSEGSCFTVSDPNVTINHIYSINTYKLTVQYVDMDGNIIPNTQPVQTNYDYDAQYTIEKKNITNYEYDHIQEGYSFTGRMPDHDLTIKVYYHKIPGDLIVNHIIEDKPTQTNTYHKFYGDDYNITPKDIEYYYFDADASSSLTGTINAPNTVLNLYYKHKKSTITHNYKSSSGATIGDSENETVNYGENINDYIKNPPKTIEGYTYHHNNKSITGNTIETADISIDYIYNLKSSNITIEYYDNNGNEIHDPLTDSKNYFANYSYSPIEIQYYTFKKVDTDYDPASGRVEKDSIKVRFIYERKTATLKVLYVDEDGNNVDPEKNRNESKNWGDTYTSEQYDFPNYDFIEMDETSDPPEGKIEKNNVTVIYKYELKTSIITVHHYAINSTTPVAPDQEIHKRYTEHYETSDVTPTNTNYEYANEHDGAPPSGTVSQPSYEITYFYKLKRGTVITHHYLYNGEETTTKLAPDVSKEWNYTDRYTTSISDQVPKNYEFYKKSDNSEDYLQSPQVDVNYYYQLKDSNLESSITITGPEEITDKNKNVDYHIKYEASIVDYIGSGTVVITNTLPYDIDVEKSDLNGGTYNKNNKTITWTHNYSDINSFEEQDDTKKITIEKDISLKYLGIVGRDRSMVSNVRGVITLSNNSRATTNNTTTNIRIKGKIVVKYVDTNGKEVFPSIEKEDLVGEAFVSSADEKEGYDLIERPESESLEYEEETQEIKYIYKRKTVKIVTKANTGGNITGDEIVFYGDDSTPDKIVIKARDGYVIESVVINGEKVDIKPNQQQLVLGQFKEMKEDYLVEVTFKEKPENPPTSKLTISFLSVLVIMFFIILVIKKKKIYRI